MKLSELKDWFIVIITAFSAYVAWLDYKKTDEQVPVFSDNQYTYTAQDSSVETKSKIIHYEPTTAFTVALRWLVVGSILGCILGSIWAGMERCYSTTAGIILAVILGAILGATGGTIWGFLNGYLMYGIEEIFDGHWSEVIFAFITSTIWGSIVAATVTEIWDILMDSQV